MWQFARPAAMHNRRGSFKPAIQSCLSEVLCQGAQLNRTACCTTGCNTAGSHLHNMLSCNGLDPKDKSVTKCVLSCSFRILAAQQALLNNCHPNVQAVLGLPKICGTGITINFYSNLHTHSNSSSSRQHQTNLNEATARASQQVQGHKFNGHTYSAPGSPLAAAVAEAAAAAIEHLHFRGAEPVAANKTNTARAAAPKTEHSHLGTHYASLH